MGAGHDAVEVVTAITVGHCETAVFHHDADAGDTLTIVLHIAGACRNPADDGHPASDRFAFDFDGGARANLATERIFCRRAVFHRPRGRICADGHGIGDPPAAPGRNVGQREDDLAAIGGDFGRLTGGLAIYLHRILAETQPARRRVGDLHRAFRTRGIVIGNDDRIENEIARLGFGARCRLGELHADAGTVERNIHQPRIVDAGRKFAAERTITDGERLAIGAGKDGQQLGGYHRRCGIGSRGFDPQAILARSDAGEPELAGAHGIGNARYIEDRFARGDGGWPGRDPVASENLRRGAGAGIDERDACARNRGTGLAVEDGVERWGDHIHRAADDHGRSDIQRHADFDSALVGHAKAAIARYVGGRRRVRFDRADKDACVYARFIDGDIFKIAGAAGDGQVHLIDTVGVPIGLCRSDLDIKSRPCRDRRGRLDIGRFVIGAGGVGPGDGRFRGIGSQAQRGGEIEPRSGIQRGAEQGDRRVVRFDLDRIEIGFRLEIRAVERPARFRDIVDRLRARRSSQHDEWQQYSEEHCCQKPEGGTETHVLLQVIS